MRQRQKTKMGNARSHKDLEENQNEKESNQFIRNRNVSSQHDRRMWF